MMHSFLPTEQTASLIFFNICLLLIMYMLMRKALKFPYVASIKNRFFTILLMFLFVLFSFWGPDWFHYQECYASLKLGGLTHIEDVYYWIAQNLSPNYLVFRLVIWGSGLILYLLTLKRMPISRDLSILLFSCIFLPYFSYTRVSLAMAMGFWGLSIMCNPHRSKILSYLLGIIFILGSFYFHKSSLFLIVILLFTILLLKFPKKTLWLLILFYPLFIYLTKGEISEFLMADMSSSNESFNSYMMGGQQYLSDEKKVHGVGANLSMLAEILPYFMLLFISLKTILKGSYRIPKTIYAFILALILIITGSSIFMFDMEANTDIVYIRFMRFAAIPSSIVLSYFYVNNISAKYTRLCYWLFILGIFYRISYVFYNNLL